MNQNYRFLHPILIVFICVVIYVFADHVFVKCWFNSCQELAGGIISQVEDSKDKDLKQIPGVLTEKSEKLADETKRIEEQTKQKKQEIVDLESSIAKQKDIIKRLQPAASSAANVANVNAASSNSGEVGGAGSAAADAEALKAANAERAKLEAKKGEIEAQMKDITKEADKIRSQILKIKSNVASRYSSRMTYMFLTGVFLLLCILAIRCFHSTVYEFVTKTDKRVKITWYFSAWVVAVVFCLIVFGSVYSDGRGYMSIVAPMFEQSIAKYGDISIFWINLSNVIGFGATIFLIFASCAILSKAPPNKSDIAPSEDSDDLRDRLRMILYLGAVMLFVGILRVYTLSGWHTSFVEPGFQELLASFFKYSLSVQAGFYAIILAAIYLSVVWYLPGTEKEKSMAALAKEGVLPTLKEILPRLIAIILPLLAGPIATLMGTFLADKPSVP